MTFTLAALVPEQMAAIGLAKRQFTLLRAAKPLRDGFFRLLL